MIDREKILKAAKYCLAADPMHCPEECPYSIENGQLCGFDPFLKDVIAYLEEQEPVSPTITADGGALCGVCGESVEAISHSNYFPSVKMHYCSYCGRKVKWNV